MPRAVASLLVLALLGGTGVALASCGEEDAQLLPGETAREITANLDTVQQLADEGDCIGAESAALQVSEQVEGLDEVDPKLKRALREGTERLNEVVAGCEEEVEAVTPDTTTEAEPTPTDKATEKEKKAREKEVEKAEKEREKEEKENEKEAEREEEPSLPPQAEGEPPSKEEGDPSGGVSPSDPVEGDE